MKNMWLNLLLVAFCLVFSGAVFADEETPADKGKPAAAADEGSGDAPDGDGDDEGAKLDKEFKDKKIPKDIAEKMKALRADLKEKRKALKIFHLKMLKLKERP